MLNSLLFNNTLCQQQVRMLRFFAGVMLAIILAFAFDWPFAFITPIFVAKFLGSKKRKLPFKVLLSILVIVLAAFILGGIVTRLFLPYPIVFLLVMTLLIFWISYWNNSGGNELVITMLLIGFTVIPMMGLLHQAVAEIFTIGFIFSCFISLLITMVMHELIADVDDDHNAIAQESKASLPAKPIRVKLALLSTLMIMPIMAFFFYFSLSSSVLILAFIAMLAQKPDLISGVKGSKALLVGNGLGGIVAIVMYNLLLISPTFAALILLFALVVIVSAQLIFSTHPLAPLFAMGFSTVIILISSATGASDGSDANFYTRILQIAGACGYVVFTTILANPLINKISKL